jgi:hypothetical protein
MKKSEKLKPSYHSAKDRLFEIIEAAEIRTTESNSSGA